LGGETPIDGYSVLVALTDVGFAFTPELGLFGSVCARGMFETTTNSDLRDV
jgi:hypothetical protein